MVGCMNGGCWNRTALLVILEISSTIENQCSLRVNIVVFVKTLAMEFWSSFNFWIWTYGTEEQWVTRKSSRVCCWTGCLLEQWLHWDFMRMVVYHNKLQRQRYHGYTNNGTPPLNNNHCVKKNHQNKNQYLLIDLCQSVWNRFWLAFTWYMEIDWNQFESIWKSLVNGVM